MKIAKILSYLTPEKTPSASSLVQIEKKTAILDESKATILIISICRKTRSMLSNFLLTLSMGTSIDVAYAQP